MKETGNEINKIDLLYCDPVEGGWRPSLCRIYTDEGIYGDGEVALSYGGASQAAFAMLKDMANRLIGMNPLDHEVIWQKLYQGCFWSYNGGPIVFGGISRRSHSGPIRSMPLPISFTAAIRSLHTPSVQAKPLK